MLLVTQATDTPLEPLSPAALDCWLLAVGQCDKLHTDILTIRDLVCASDDVIEEWEHAAVATRLPFGHIRILARGMLWDFSSVRHAA
jgi:hypothetical protein